MKVFLQHILFYLFVKVLLGQGADVDVADSFGYTALIWAADNNHDDVAGALIDSGKKY